MNISKVFHMMPHPDSTENTCVHAKSLQSCPALSDPVDCSPPGSSVRGISRREHWSGVPCPPPGELPDPGIEPAALVSPALAGRFFTTSATREAENTVVFYQECPLLFPFKCQDSCIHPPKQLRYFVF